MNKFTPGPWWFREFHGSAEDIALQKKLGMPLVPALSNDGERYLMSGSNDFDGPVTRIALVTCITEFKRGKGHQTECAERDANARLIAAAPDLLEALQFIRRIWPADETCDEARMADAAIAKATS